MNFHIECKQKKRNANSIRFKGQKYDKKELLRSLNCKVVIEKSRSVEELILAQSYKVDSIDINRHENQADKANEMKTKKNVTATINMDSEKTEMKERKTFVLPANLPKIQVTFKSSGEETTRIIKDNTKIDKVVVKRKSWMRKKNNEIFENVRITSKNEIFSDAALGPQNPELIDSERLVQIKRCISNLENHIESHPSTSKIFLPSESQSKVTIIPKQIPPLIITIPIAQTQTEKSPREKSPILKSPSKNISPSPPLFSVSNISTPSLSPISFSSNETQSMSSFKVDKSVEECVSKETLEQPVFVESKMITKSVVPPKVISGFKVPLAPKRPPTRLKYVNDLRDVLQQRHIDQFPPTNTNLNDDDDDVLSLYAESIGSTFDVTVTKKSSTLAEDFTKDVDINEDFSKNTIDFSKSLQDNTAKIENKSPLITSSAEPDVIINPKITEWISKSSTVNKNQSMDYGNFPKRWCYPYLETGKCVKFKCPFKHTMLEVDFNAISPENFEIIFNGCVKFTYLFKTFFDSLLNYLMEKERKDLILSLVLHVMKRVKDEKMPFVKKIITTLKNIGFTFVEAINEILFTCGRSNEGLLDILLAFAVEDEDCVKTSWNVIANLINFRRTGLDFGVTQDIFTKCLNDYDQILAENIYKDVIVKNNFNLNQIDRSILINYILLLQDHHKEGAEYIITNYNINEFELKNQKLSCQDDQLNEEINEIKDEIDLSDTDLEESNLGNNNLILSSQDENDSGNCNQLKSNQHLKETHSNPRYYCDIENQYRPYIPRKRSKIETSPSSSDTLMILPEVVIDDGDLTDQDIKDLVISVRSHNLGSMFSVMNRYSDTEVKIKNVVLHFMAVAKEMDLNTLCNLLSQMFNVFGNHCKTDYQTMNVLKTLGFNLIPRLDKEKQYKTISDILTFFANDYNSFVKYNYFSNDRKYHSNEMKYVLLFKILCRCDKYNDAYELLKNHESQLLEVFLPETEVINEYKISVLNKCLEHIIVKDPVEAKDMIVYLMLNANVELWPDLKMYLNILLTQFLHNYTMVKDEVNSMFDVILNGWYQYLKPSVLRSLLISTRPDVPTKTILKLFNLCIEMGVYPDHKGRDNSISIPSNLLKEEISLLVHHQFLQICSSLFPISNIVINVTEPLDGDEYTRLHIILKSNALTTSDMINRVLMVLENIPNFPAKETLDVQNQYIVIPYCSAFLQPYKDAMKSGVVPKIP
ncbi:reticulocyte-binding protein homolog 1-like isoform X2 [Onthophagus taurus]|uniref:reticulocyte-binding protein homolog 1-like isoform X1 n=2 Tax=Onthophagus taurus TaxID=166361 RepID=UPI0039BE8EAF